MRIRKLEIIGFKSFVDRTVLHFDRDVVGVVGPNGCGKSNVIDALRWVMGEQSPGRLRARQMEDVIFGGSQVRGPHAFAEVTATFDNSQGLAPPDFADYAEISVARRLDRSGRSDYYINKTSVRLLDITNLFLGTGVGKRAYSVIEQGRIGLIVSSKSEDRRQMIEEAAGITKFKARKQAAERKMAQTTANLQRIGDIISEIERGLGNLKRQAQKAERYRALKAELRDLELWVGTTRFFELETRGRYLHAEASTLRQQVGDGERTLAQVEAHLEALRARLTEQEVAVDGLARQLFESESQARLAETEALQAQERFAGLGEKEALATRELTTLSTERGTLLEELGKLDGAAEALVLEAQTLERAVTDGASAAEEATRNARQAEHEVRQLRVALGQAEAQKARLESSLSGMDQRALDAAGRLEMLTQAEKEALPAREKAEAARQAARDQLDALETQRAELKASLDTARKQLEATKQEGSALETALRTAEGAAGRLRAERSSLESLMARLEGVRPGARALLKNKPGRTLLAGALSIDPALAPALSAVLGPAFEGVLLSDAEDAPVALRELLAQKTSRTVLLLPASNQTPGGDAQGAEVAVGARATGSSRVAAQSAGVASAELDAQLKQAGAKGLFASVLGLPTSDEGTSLAGQSLHAAQVLRRLLDGVALVEQLAEAEALCAQFPAVEAWVALDGTVFRPGLLLAAGEEASEGGLHLMRWSQRLRELDVSIGEAEAAAGQAEAERAAQRALVEALAAGLETEAQSLHALELERVRLAGEVRAAEQSLAQHAADTARIASERQSLSARLGANDQAKAEALSALTEVQAALNRDTASQGDKEAVLVRANAALGEVQGRLTEARIKAAEAATRLASHQATQQRLRRSTSELEGRINRLSTEAEASVSEQQALTVRLAELSELRTKLAAQKEQLSTAHAAQRQRYDTLRGELGESEVNYRERFRELETSRRTLGELDLQLREAAAQQRDVEARLLERYNVSLYLELNDYHARPLPGEEVNARIAELGRALGALGEVNLLAIEEFEAKSERHTYLTAQRTDLEEALAELTRAIRTMNKESRRLFAEAFEAINERFQFVFPGLFGGGKAELRLTDPGDLLETGVDIIAQPPGKRLGSLELMSGGEKALTAVSMLFAIFQYRPSPFCVLDEVDAPLDEANIGRFANAVRQMTDRSQFILITHSKRTMEHADILYGVTMEDPGVSKLVAVELSQTRNLTPGAAA